MVLVWYCFQEKWSSLISGLECMKFIDWPLLRLTEMESCSCFALTWSSAQISSSEPSGRTASFCVVQCAPCVERWVMRWMLPGMVYIIPRTWPSKVIWCSSSPWKMFACVFVFEFRYLSCQSRWHLPDWLQSAMLLATAYSSTVPSTILGATCAWTFALPFA